MAKKESHEKIVTVLGEDTVFEGVLKFSQNVEIRGSFSGAIDAQGVLFIDKNAKCTIDYMKAASIEVLGSVTGPLEAADRIEMHDGCVVHGNVSAKKIRIADNVRFEGAVHMIKETVSPDTCDIFKVNASQLKEQLEK